MAWRSRSWRSLIWPRWAAVAAMAALSFWAGAQWGAARALRQQKRAGQGASARRGDMGLDLAASARAHGRLARPQALPMPGEFEPQAAMLLACNELLPCFPDIFKQVVTAVHGRLTVICLVGGEMERQLLMTALTEADLPLGAVRLAPVPLDTMWIRDYGPLFIQRADGTAVVADLDYSPPDATMEVRRRDDDAPRALADLLELPLDVVPLRMGGGNLLSNGEGLYVTTTTLLRDNLAGGYTAEGIESILRERLGARRWLALRPLEGERTGHADMFLAFLAPDLAVVGQLDPAADPANAAILDEAAAALARERTGRGPMRVHRIPMPPAGNGLWRSYTNVILADGLVLAPTFSDVDPALQNQALGLYARLLPGWRVVGVNCDGLAASDGVLHCITRHIPRFIPAERIEKASRRVDFILDGG